VWVVLGILNLVFGFWYLDFGFWYLDFGIWILVLVSIVSVVSGFKFQVSNSEFIIWHLGFVSIVSG